MVRLVGSPGDPGSSGAQGGQDGQGGQEDQVVRWSGGQVSGVLGG